MIFYNPMVLNIQEWKKIMNSQVVLWGAGKGGEEITEIMLSMGIVPDYIVDRDIAKHGKEIHGIQIFSPKVLYDEKRELVVVISIISKEIVKEILDELERNGISQVVCADSLFEKCELSYAQNGEDIIVSKLFEDIFQKEIIYYDIGANDPVLINNTYLLYRKGNKGILVEPNTSLCEKLKEIRPRDTVLNYGISTSQGDMEYYVLDNDRLSTFSKEEAELCLKYGNKIIRVDKIKTVNLNYIFSEYGKPDYISIDIEGMDFEIVKEVDFELYAPLCICLETLVYNGGKKESFEDLSSFLKEKGYFIYSDTWINTIFVKKQAYDDAMNRLVNKEEK